MKFEFYKISFPDSLSLQIPTKKVIKIDEIVVVLSSFFFLHVCIAYPPGVSSVA